MSAVISDCGRYRYRLERQTIAPSGTILWIMVNPSTADASNDDPTIRKVVGFSKLMGFNRIVVGNLFAYRATDVRELKHVADPIGPDNNYHLDDMIAWADKIMFAWGPIAKQPKGLRDRWFHVDRQVRLRGKKPFCLGTAKDGHPLHPLMQPYAAEVKEWEPAL